MLFESEVYLYRMSMSTGHHSRESGYDHEVFTSWIVRGAEKKRCRAALTLCMQPQELGWNAGPSVVAQLPAAGMDACAAGALQPIGHEESAMRGGEVGCQLELNLFAEVLAYMYGHGAHWGQQSVDICMSL